MMRGQYGNLFILYAEKRQRTLLANVEEKAKKRCWSKYFDSL